jgi:hypothetical protein
MTHRSGDRADPRRSRPVPPSLLPPAGPWPDSRLLAPPSPDTARVRVRPVPARPPARFRLSWWDLIAIALIVAALAALYVRR